MYKKQAGFSTLLVIIPIVVVAITVGVFVNIQNRGSSNNEYKFDAPNNPELTSLAAPYVNITDLAGVGPYSNNQAEAGYIHNGLDFMSGRDLVEYRAVSGGVVAELKVFYDSSRSDTHPQVNVIILYNKTTKVVYSFEPYSKDIADAERQLTFMSIKEGDTIVAGQVLGKLIKTAPQSHVHIHVMKDRQTICFEDMFSDIVKAEMLTIATTPLNKPKKLCYE
jgi:hypothetical protein